MQDCTKDAFGAKIQKHHEMRRTVGRFQWKIRLRVKFEFLVRIDILDSLRINCAEIIQNMRFERKDKNIMTCE